VTTRAANHSSLLALLRHLLPTDRILLPNDRTLSFHDLPRTTSLASLRFFSCFRGGTHRPRTGRACSRATPTGPFTGRRPPWAFPTRTPPATRR
jgi:hypothetical protein